MNERYEFFLHYSLVTWYQSIELEFTSEKEKKFSEVLEESLTIDNPSLMNFVSNPISDRLPSPSPTLSREELLTH